MQFKNQVNFSVGMLAVNNENYYDVYHKNVNRGWINLNINTDSRVRGGAFMKPGNLLSGMRTPLMWGGVSIQSFG